MKGHQSMKPAIELKGVYKKFGSVSAIDGLSFTIEQGEILSLLGPTGCGKTTTLRLIAGLEEPDEGSVIIAGRIVADASTWVPPEQRKVGMVFQDYAIFPHLTVWENIAFGLKGITRRELKERVRKVLELVGLLELQGRYPHELSGGQQQRVALARALAPGPQVVLLDEPFSNLDADMRAQMRRDVQAILRRTNSTAIFVTHDQEEAFVISDRIGVLNQGRLEQLDTPEEVYHRPLTRFVADFVGLADFLQGWVTAEGIATELGTFENLQNIPFGLRVDVMIRPEDVETIVDEGGNGLVVYREFKGPEIFYTIRLPSGQLVISARPSTDLIPLNTRVKVWANPHHVVVFRPDEMSQ